MKKVNRGEQLDELAESFVARYRRGERPTVEEYAAKYPDLADQLCELLPTLVLLEQQSQLEHTEPLGAVAPCEHEFAPREIGDFTIVREVGRGGMGMVYEAVQRSLSRRVALKVLPLAATLDQRALQRFRNETMAVAQLDHPNVVDVFGVGSDRGIHFYAMRFIDGSSLADVIGRLCAIRGDATSAFPEALSDPAIHAEARDVDCPERVSGHQAMRATSVGAAAQAAETVHSNRLRAGTRHSLRRPAYFRSIAELGIQVAEALDHAHQVGIIHRDIKPSNLMVDTRGKVWVTDFGLARIEAAGGMTMTGDLIGTLRYMSPEQALAKRIPIDHRADIYSLGVTLYELLALRPAFGSDDRRELLRQIAFEEPLMPRRLDPAIPLELETVVCKAMAKNPAERYATAQELADDLRRFFDDQPILARRPSLASRIGRWSRHHKSLVATAALLVALTAVGSTGSAVMLAEERSKTTTALAASEEQKRQLEINSQKLEREQRRAEASFRKAREAVDRLFTRAAAELQGQPHMEKVRQRLLEDALVFYEGFLRDNGDDLSVQEEAAQAYLQVGFIRQMLGQYAQSLEPLETARKLLEELIKQRPDDAVSRQRLAAAHMITAYSMLNSGAPDKNLAHRRNALVVLDDLHKQWPQNAEYAQQLADAREEYACALSIAGQYKQAIDEFARARDQYEKLHAGFPELPRDRVRMAHFHHWLGKALYASGLVANAEQEYRLAHDLRTQLLDEVPTDAERKHSLAHIKSYLADLLIKTGRAEQALELVEQAVALDEQCLDEFPGRADYIRRTAADYGMLENVLTSLGRLADSEAALQRSSKLFERLGGDSIGAAVADSNLAWASYELGARFEAAGEREKAADQFRKAIATLEQLASEHPESPKYLDYLSWMLTTCPAVQFRDPGRAVKLASQVLQRLPNSAESWELLGIAQYRLGDFAAAITSLTKAEQLGGGERIVGWLFMAMAQWQSGDQQAARELLGKASAWIAKNRSTDTELQRFHTEAIELINGGTSVQAETGTFN